MNHTNANASSRSAHRMLRAKETYIVGAIVILLAVGAIFYRSLGEGSAQTARDSVIAAPARGIHLTAAQRKSAGVAVQTLQVAPLAPLLRAPGEVRTNDYVTQIVSPRITATIVKRHAKLGEAVTKGQALVTLYSQDMAEAQSGYVLAERDLTRFQRLNESAAIAGQQLDQAVAKRAELYGRLQSLGLTPEQIAGVALRGLGSRETGQFDLVAPAGGTITKDEFKEGDVVEPGKALFEITDPKNVWVEAFVSPTQVAKLGGTSATVLAGGKSYPAKVAQVRDIIDETTRTVGIRLQVNNPDTTLKPGQFVDVELRGAAKPVSSIPTAAVLRNEDGSWLVYRENPDRSFSPLRVSVLFASGNQTAIAGIPAGTRVVASGAFFVRSEGEKASFGGED